MKVVLWKRKGARFLTADVWRVRVIFRVSPSWRPRWRAFDVAAWWKDDYQMHHWLIDVAEEYGHRAYNVAPRS